MEFIIITIAALCASMLTLFSGFGLGMLLMPFFALFFSVDLAIAMTAVVHLLNNFFKLILVGKFVDKDIVIKFGVAAMVSSVVGALLLGEMSAVESIYEYEVLNRTASITPLKVLIALLLLMFVWLESHPTIEINLERKYLWLGGILSGFFGGLSGHQGVFRSMFLLKCNLTRESFIATGVVIACVIDVARLLVYRERFALAFADENISLLLSACLAAFLGAFIGARLMPKVTMRLVQRIVVAMLILIAVLLASGII
ncbi:MAG: TSUP family transporter [Chlorobiales bacterium]